jgi:NACalpha-BTF3-like transcription factor
VVVNHKLRIRCIDSIPIPKFEMSSESKSHVSVVIEVSALNASPDYNGPMPSQFSALSNRKSDANQGCADVIRALRHAAIFVWEYNMQHGRSEHPDAVQSIQWMATIAKNIRSIGQHSSHSGDDDDSMSGHGMTDDQADSPGDPDTVRLVMIQGNCTRSMAEAALRECRGNILDSILLVSSTDIPDHPEYLE